jgi:succinoglycan biosynthesis protein ExoW
VTKISIVIPYFQKVAGTLNRTLLAIQSQDKFSVLDRIILVDDGSPIPANAEIMGLSKEFIDKLDIVEKENGGVSKARNLGLSSLPEHTDYVIFLDSDDVWQPFHLTQLVEAINNNADFYFSNFLQLHQKIPAFERGGKLNLQEHEQVSTSLYQYQGDMVSQILTGNLIGTSTVGYHYKKYPSFRFREDLKFAGEDYLFWLKISLTKPKIMFNTNPSVVYGEGVNIFSSATWGSLHLQQRLCDEIMFRSSVLDTFELPQSISEEIKSRLKENSRQLFRNTISNLKHGRIKAIKMLLLVIVKKPNIITMAIS